MAATMERQLIERAAQLLRASHSAVAITGAGISTPSGVPDFRSKHGLWQSEPSTIACLGTVQREPQRFIRWFQPLLEKLIDAQPNGAHEALVQLERLGSLCAIITQNIDGLHQRAGSGEVYELHGNLRSATCLACDHQIPGAALVARARRGELLRCACGGVFRPDIVLFDELLPRGLFWLAQRAIDRADIVLVAGTSLEVAPVCDLPFVALQRGARVIVVNQSPTSLDTYADVVLRADVAEVLPAIAAAVAAQAPAHGMRLVKGVAINGTSGSGGPADTL
jgi:NAD-dependent deacetylase